MYSNSLIFNYSDRQFLNDVLKLATHSKMSGYKPLKSFDLGGFCCEFIMCREDPLAVIDFCTIGNR